MIDLKTIKLIIWDLDDTFWEGILSEGGAKLPPQNARLIKDLTDCGIINSICSKNEFEPTKQHLQDLGVWDLFVFPSINWESKGPQLKEKLDKMALRPVNVLFLDDNPSNLGEARHYLPDIQIAGPEVIDEIIDQTAVLEKKDLNHKRLNQYKILEEKDTVSRTYSNNEAFLYDSRIQVEMHYDCVEQIQRLHELLMRSNQLNYTKKRISIEELESVLTNPKYNCGYVTVKDRFGDYGIVGFYAVIDNRLEHFLFSCRTMGQKIEQWVYAQLGFPELEVVGEVRTKLNKSECPGWINIDGEDHLEKSPDKAEELHCRILLKGPCDLSHSQVYIKGTDAFDTEYTYVNEVNGQIIDAQNHSVHIEGLKTYSEDDKRQIVEDCIFVDPVMLTESGFFTKDYDVIFLSTLIESSYYIYQKKGTNIRVVFNGEQLMTDPNNWDGYCDGSIRNGDNHFTRAYLKEFSDKYECIGQTTPESYIGFLRKCLQWLPEKTNLCLILGATNSNYDKEDKNNKHKLLNEAIIKFAEQQPRIHYIEIDSCIHDLSDFDGDIDHFSNRVYYEIAQSMIRVIQQVTGRKINSYSSNMVAVDNMVRKVRKGLKRIMKPNGKLYGMMKSVYNKIYKNRK
jgi:FkbH-like protein